MEQFIELILKYASVPVLLVTGYAVLTFRQLRSELKVFSYFLFLAGVVEAISKILWFQSINNLPLLHAYVAGGFVLQAWFYNSVLKGFINSSIIWFVVILFTTFTVVNSLFFQSIYTFNSYAVSAQAILILIFSLSTYILLLNDIVRKEKVDLLKSVNWINSGMFLYYASSLVIFYFSDMIFTYYSDFANKYLWSIHALFLIIMNVCFFIGLWNRPAK